MSKREENQEENDFFEEGEENELLGKKELLKKMQRIMIEGVEVMFEEETRTKVVNKIRSIFTKEDIPFTSKTIMAFVEGLELGSNLIKKDVDNMGEIIMPVSNILRHRVLQAEKNKKKLS